MSELTKEQKQLESIQKDLDNLPAFKYYLPLPRDQIQTLISLARQGLQQREERCLVCNGVGDHEEGCRGTSPYDQLTAEVEKLRADKKVLEEAVRLAISKTQEKK